MAEPKSLVMRTARWSATHPWRAIALWLVFVAVAFMVGGSAETRVATGVDTMVGEAGEAARMIEDADVADPATENVLITAESGQLDSATAVAAAEDAAARLRGLADVATVQEPITSAEGEAVLLQLTIAGDIATAAQRVGPLMTEVADVDQSYPELRVEVVGDGTLQRGFADLQSQDLGSATLFSVPVTLLIMLVVFGAIVAAGVPVLLALSAVVASMGLWALASQVVPDPGTVLHVILLMGMAVGVDYSLFYVKRQREERARGNGKVDAIALAAATSGRAVVVAGLSTIVAMTALYLADDAVFSAMATGAILVVAVTLLGSLTVLPAMLARFGRLLERPRVPVVWRLANRGGRSRVWAALLRPSLRYPLSTLLVAMGVLVALAVPALGMQFKNVAMDDLPRAIPEMQTYDRMVESFPSEGNVHLVAVRAPADRSEEVRQALENLTASVAADPLFTSDQPHEVRTGPDGQVHTVKVATPHASDSQEAKDSLASLRGQYAPDAISALDGVEYAVGGTIAVDVDYSGNLREKLPWVIGAALLFIMVVMVWAFRSIMIAGVTMVLNAMSTLAAFGVVTWVFQNTWAEGLLGFESTGHVVAWVPALLFVILLGLSMDYHVFIVSRIRELRMTGMSTREAVPAGITQTASVVTSAASVMVLVFSIFALMSFVELKQIGIGLMVAILIDATVVRILALPSVMILLDRFTWWPSQLFRSHDGRASGPSASRDNEQRAMAVRE